MNSIPYLAAEALTAAALSQGSTDADKLARAKTASQVAAFFGAAGKGDVTGANAQIATAISGIKDPGLQKVASDLWATGQPFIQVEFNIAANVPILGGSMTQALTDIGAGMASVAGAYIAKYSTTAK